MNSAYTVVALIDELHLTISVLLASKCILTRKRRDHRGDFGTTLLIEAVVEKEFSDKKFKIRDLAGNFALQIDHARLFNVSQCFQHLYATDTFLREKQCVFGNQMVEVIKLGS
jgi:hypothetical protein